MNWFKWKRDATFWRDWIVFKSMFDEESKRRWFQQKQREEQRERSSDDKPKRDRMGYQGRKPSSCRLIETLEGLDYTIVWSDGREETVRLKTFGSKEWE